MNTTKLPVTFENSTDAACLLFLGITVQGISDKLKVFADIVTERYEKSKFTTEELALHICGNINKIEKVHITEEVKATEDEMVMYIALYGIYLVSASALSLEARQECLLSIASFQNARVPPDFDGTHLVDYLLEKYTNGGKSNV